MSGARVISLFLAVFLSVTLIGSPVLAAGEDERQRQIARVGALASWSDVTMRMSAATFVLSVVGSARYDELNEKYSSPQKSLSDLFRDRMQRQGNAPNQRQVEEFLNQEIKGSWLNRRNYTKDMRDIARTFVAAEVYRRQERGEHNDMQLFNPLSDRPNLPDSAAMDPVLQAFARLEANQNPDVSEGIPSKETSRAMQKNLYLALNYSGFDMIEYDNRYQIDWTAASQGRSTNSIKRKIAIALTQHLDAIDTAFGAQIETGTGVDMEIDDSIGPSRIVLSSENISNEYERFVFEEEGIEDQSANFESNYLDEAPDRAADYYSEAPNRLNQYDDAPSGRRARRSGIIAEERNSIRQRLISDRRLRRLPTENRANRMSQLIDGIQFASEAASAATETHSERYLSPLDGADEILLDAAPALSESEGWVGLSQSELAATKAFINSRPGISAIHRRSNRGFSNIPQDVLDQERSIINEAIDHPERTQEALREARSSRDKDDRDDRDSNERFAEEGKI